MNAKAVCIGRHCYLEGAIFINWHCLAHTINNDNN
ncbi:Uncharacterised protein [Vibrio cholerae]|nr:Uncharacterised protein [Vibrio cholerae]